MPAYQLLDYGTRIAQTVERMRHDRDVVEELRLWGGRLLTLIDRTAPRIKQFDLTEGLLRQRCLVVTGLAMTGQLDEAVEALRQVEEMPKLPRTISHVIRTFTAVALSVHQYRGSQDVLRFIIDEWDYVGTYLERTSVILSADKVTALSGSRFRRHVYNIVSEIEKPVTLLQDMEKRWSNHTWELAGSLLIESLCYAEMGHDALDVLDYMKLQSLRVRPEQRLAVVLALVQSDAFQLANRLYQDIISFMTTGSLYDRYLSTGLHLYAHQGDVARAEEFYSKLAHRGQAGIRQKTLFMHAHAVRGDSARVVELFRHIFLQDESSQPRPGVIQYTTVIYAHAQAGDMAGMTQWLDAMADAGIKHDNQLYDIILKSFATRGEVVFMSELLDRMRAAGILPGKESYTTIIALLARRNDPIAAEEVFKRALQEGVTPDRRMITTLMNAYVESGQWHGVVRTFDYITASAHRGIRLSLEVFNTLLKAYVLIGAPFRIVAGVFQRLEQARVRPDAYTFALLIQSACDSGLLEIAQDLLAEMDRLAASWQSNLHINVHALTIVMAAYLRKGDRGKAKALFDEMRRRGLQPTPVTYGAIVKAYGKDRKGAGLAVAEEFVRGLAGLAPRPQEDVVEEEVDTESGVEAGGDASDLAAASAEADPEAKLLASTDTYDGATVVTEAVEDAAADTAATQEAATIPDADGPTDPALPQAAFTDPNGRDWALSTIFAPLLSSFVRRKKPREVERLIDDMLAAGGERTLGSVTALMDAYRRRGHTDAVLQLWPEIEELGLRQAKIGSLLVGAEGDPKPDLRGHGTALCIPLSIAVDALSAGGRHAELAQVWGTLHDAQLAFDSHNWNHLAVALVRAGDPVRAFQVVEKVILPYQRKMRTSVSLERNMQPDTPVFDRAAAEAELPAATSESPLHRRDRRSEAVWLTTRKLRVPEERPDDFAHVLHILAEVSPLWSAWRVHRVVMDVFLDVMRHLQSGRVVQPLMPRSERHTSQNHVTDVETLTKRTAIAERHLGTIYDTCPNTVRLVQDYDILSQARIRRMRDRRH